MIAQPDGFLFGAVVFGLGLFAGGIGYRLLTGLIDERNPRRREFIVRIAGRTSELAVDAEGEPACAGRPQRPEVRAVDRRKNGFRSPIPYAGAPANSADIFARGTRLRMGLHPEAAEDGQRLRHG